MQILKNNIVPFCRISLSGVSPCKLRLIYRASKKSLISSMRLLFVLIAPKNNFDWQKNLLLTTYRTCDVKNPKSDIFFCSPFSSFSSSQEFFLHFGIWKNHSNKYGSGHIKLRVQLDLGHMISLLCVVLGICVFKNIF